MTASVLGLGGVMLLGAPLASAEEAPADANTVTFEGNCGLIGLGKSSRPNPSELTIEEGTRVTFVNGLGTKAKLTVGDSSTTLSEDQQATMTLAESVDVTMEPECGLLGLGESDEASIKVTERSTSPEPDEPNDPPAGDNGGSDEGTAPGSGDGGDSDGAQKPGDAPDSGSRPVIDPDDPAADGAVPPDSGAEAPADGTAPATDDATTPAGTAPGTPGSSAPGEFAVEPVGGDVSGGGATGLLALIATVCLVGVGAAAVRTVATQRSAAH